MAFREVTMLEVKEILRLWLRGVPKKRIAQQLGFDVKTVRRYLDAAKSCGIERNRPSSAALTNSAARPSDGEVALPD